MRDDQSEWACFACTFFNVGSSEICEMCGTPKGFGGADPEAPGDSPEVRLEYREGTSAKFWCLKISGCTTIVTFGRIGTEGQTDTKVHNNEGEARKFAAKIQREKEKKGYA